MVVLMSLHDGLPAQEFWRSARQRMARIRAQVRQRRVRVIRFESDQWVELEFFRDDGTRDRLRAVYAPVVLFMVFSSVLTHGITIPISKLGPGVMRRTATLTKTRSITFSRPVSRSNTLQVSTNNNNNNGGEDPSSSPEHSDSGRGAGSSHGSSRGHVGYDESGKPLWNPLVAVADWTVHVLAFWRKDSFWRKDVVPGKHNAFSHGHAVNKTEISAPSRPVKQRSVEDDAIIRAINESHHTPSVEVNADGEQMKPRLPPPAMELPTTGSGVRMPSPILQSPSSFGSGGKGEKKPEMAELKRTVSPRRFAILRAFDKEMNSERQEAQSEAQQGWERGELREQKRLLEMLQRSGAATKQSESGAHESADAGRTEARPDPPAEAEQDAQSTHSSQRRTLRFI